MFESKSTLINSYQQNINKTRWPSLIFYHCVPDRVLGHKEMNTHMLQMMFQPQMQF